MSGLLSAPWFYWAVGIAVGLPLALVALTEWQRAVRRRGSALLGPVTVLRNYLLPLAAVLAMMVGATGMPSGSTPVRIVGTLVAIVVLVLLLSGVKASFFSSAPEGSWRRRVPGIIVDVIRFVLITVGIGLILAFIWGANVGGLFTALGIGSIVIGLTLQNSVGQIISGLLMLFEQPFRLGDWIETDKAKGRVTEVNWRAVHLETSTGLRVTPNSMLAGESFTNLSRPAGRHTITVESVFAVEDRPERVCAMLERVASRLPQCNPDASPSAVPAGSIHYRTEIPLTSPRDDGAAKATFLRWVWYAARRDGLHLDECDETFGDPDELAAAITAVVAPVLRLDTAAQGEIAEYAKIERYGAGEMIQASGTIPEGLWFIVDGSVVVTVDDDATSTEVLTLERGSSLGQSTLVRHPAFGSAYAVDEVTMVWIEREAIEDVVQRNPQLLAEFGRVIAERRNLALHTREDAD